MFKVELFYVFNVDYNSGSLNNATITSVDNTLHNNNEKYVECNWSVGGLANKMFGFVSSIVIASLLNATLICN